MKSHGNSVSLPKEIITDNKHYMKKTLLTLALLSATSVWAQRIVTTLTDHWQFSRDRQSWTDVTVPHDWAISGPFDKKWDLQVVAIEQNGEKQATEKSGRSGALPWIGEGHYRRTITLPQQFSGRAVLMFDGAMAEPTVSVNGRKAGYWAYGYNAFNVDVTEFVHPGDNLLEVDLRNVEESSRWYPGAGIYRPVQLVLTGRDAIQPWGVCFRTLAIADGSAEVEVSARVTGGDGVEVTLLDDKGQVVCAAHDDVLGDGTTCAVMEVAGPRLWTPEQPFLYTLRVQLMQNGRTVDEVTERVGIRTVLVSRDGGFQLNGVSRKLKGVCLHHDLGPLGAAVNKAALIRQIKTMKAMGCDAIRTAHNMPSQLQMQVCDSLGMMVMAESFDMWRYPKCKNGYARFFQEWSDRDIENLVLANRNHPAIVMWSIGNEIPEQGMKGGRETAAHLQDLCHRLDPTRPVTQGCDRPDIALKTGFLQTMDVPGLNYRLHRYQSSYDQLPQGFLLGSETASTVSTRGAYYFPVVEKAGVTRPDGQCSGYDVEWCSWSNLPDDDWRWQDDKPWVIGEFVWTGFDYLGEPTPYDEYWPSRSSYFGICDLAGLPKDRYWLYRSHWNTREHTLHLLPHWTWDKTRRGQVTPVYCYTDYPEAELFVNGRSQGRIRKNAGSRLDRYRLRWNDVRYEPGELRVVAYDAGGRPAGEQTVRTAGKPHHLQLDVWTQQSPDAAVLPLGADSGPRLLHADGQDLAFVTVTLVDEQGTPIPDAQDQLTFDVSGAGTFRAVCNGDATSLEPFTQPAMRLFHGQLVAVVQAGKQPGTLTLTVSTADGRLTAQTGITVR